SNTASVESEHPNTPANINNSVSVIWTEGDNSPFSVLYYGELLPVNINENNSGFLINIYPNPTTGIFTIKNLKASERPLNVEITNINGQIIKQYSIINNQSEIDLSGQAKGIYFVKIQTDKTTYTNKIIVQ
ncbi:MAG: T9SS type A sorting domain-containing protein, partial [Bacteroidota bacterium]|nr:T9SS type A sorting domain-containing protein [Bacteroidota bacterium]